MAIKLKNNFKKHLTKVWLAEILYLILFTYYLFITLYKNKRVDQDIYTEFEQGIVSIKLNENIHKDLKILLGFGTILFLIILIKLIYVLIKEKRNFEIRGNFILSIIYVFRYGLKYEKTKKLIIATGLGVVIFFIVYLYLIAIGGNQNNILVSFFKVYPFKGSIVMVLIVVAIILHSIKKTIEISRINDKLKETNNYILKSVINDRSSKEAIELVENILKLKERYQLAVDDRLTNERLKTELISNVSHDLRTPLTSIINYVNILQEDGLSEEEKKEYLKIVDKKSKRLKILIDDLFEMSKINSGKIELRKETIDVMSLIHQAIGEYSYIYENKNIDFNVDSFNEEIPMLLDGKMISRAIENIVINALKYSLENTRIYVTIKIKGSMIEIAFKNISNYFMKFDTDEMFERFARGDKSRNSNIEGSGLGLAITKSIVELHSGEVKIKREGDMFKIYVYLPISEQ